MKDNPNKKSPFTKISTFKGDSKSIRSPLDSMRRSIITINHRERVKVLKKSHLGLQMKEVSKNLIITIKNRNHITNMISNTSIHNTSVIIINQDKKDK